ncbi:MAG TPA: HAD-IB family phosphatase [Acidimicrobiales bacterium]|nr:HAD-IB family phosphatase [Acidimicrobiales bacterium]
MAIGEQLAGKRFFVTGGTGFLGTALVERLIRTVPGSEVVVLVRPGRRATASQRATREILKNDCFDRLRDELGDRFDDEVGRRVVAVAGDVGRDGLGLDDDGRRLLAASDVVIHSAATVSFDAPLDQAVEINLLGPSRVAAAVAAARRDAGTNGTAGHPGPEHLIAVSTAYVAGTHQGEAREELLRAERFSLEVDWEAEVAHARRLRGDLEAASRHPDRLAGFAKKARSELGGAGEHLLATRAEKIREDWIKRQMVDAGTARAQALGWPDAYPFTKALGERALTSQYGLSPAANGDIGNAGVGRRGGSSAAASLAAGSPAAGSGGTGGAPEGVPITIVRPSIIESALAEPRPGWIRGFRMAEPIIISYARGLLKEFPGVPEGVLDVIPVDLVVAAIIAVAAAGPTPEGPSVYQVASGVRNPLRYGRLVELIQDWFGRHPLYDDRGQPISVPEWSFPGRGRVQRQLERATKTMDLVEKVATSLPVRGRQAALSAKVEERNALAKRALSYVELYGAYTETEARYRVDRLVALWETLDDADKATWCFDPAVVDWDHYAHEVHLPSIVAHARVRTSPGKSVVDKRPDRARRAILSPDRHLAVFDLEHTLMASNVVDTYAWLASRHLSKAKRAKFVAELLAEAPKLLALDRRDRGDFLRSFYRRYEDAPVDQLAEDGWELFHRQLLTRSFPAGLARVREHRRLGHRTLLITGALDFVIAPLRPLFDDIVCARLGQRDGRYDGRLEELPPIGEARALLLQDYAAAYTLSLEEAVAYADSASDLAMLEAVGFPVAVNPESRLSAIARRRGWHVEHWAKAAGGAERPLPLGPLDAVRPGGRSGAGYSATGGFATAWAAARRAARQAGGVAGSGLAGVVETTADRSDR